MVVVTTHAVAAVMFGLLALVIGTLTVVSSRSAILDGDEKLAVRLLMVGFSAFYFAAIAAVMLVGHLLTA